MSDQLQTEDDRARAHQVEDERLDQSRRWRDRQRCVERMDRVVNSIAVQLAHGERVRGLQKDEGRQIRATVEEEK